MSEINYNNTQCFKPSLVITQIGNNQKLSEEIIQKGYEDHGLKIGKYQFYNIGATTISTLKKYKIIPNKDYKEYDKKKPDALLVDRRNKSKPSVIAVIEHKSPDEFKTKKQKDEAVEQGNNYAQVLKAKIGIATDKSTFIWFNPNHKNTKNRYLDKTSKIDRSYTIIQDENKNQFMEKFNIDQKIDESEIIKLNVDTRISLEKIKQVLDIVTKTNSKFTKIPTQDPTKLAHQIWQDVWSVTGKDPEKCLYTFVELFIFKYLSDLGILTEDENGNKINFDYIYSLDEKKAFKNYSSNVRKYLKSMFKEGSDGTTIINGTVLNPTVSGHDVVFCKILKKFNDFGEIKNIDPSFKSKVFEDFMKESISTKNWGRYFTPRNVIDAMIEISDIDKLEKGSKICDPACGVGGFVLEPIKVKNNVKFYYPIKLGGEGINPRYRFYGFDKGFEKEEQLTIILAKANMLIFLSELLKNNESIIDSFSDLLNNTFHLTTSTIMGTLEKTKYDQYDLILTNPPYVTSGSSNYKDRIKSDPTLKKFYEVNAIGTEGLFLEWIINSLKPSKKAFVIIPQSILERDDDNKLRQFILDECIIDGLIRLPPKTFYTTIKKTYILAITKKSEYTKNERKMNKQEENIFTYIVTDIGETLDNDRLPKSENDLIDMISLFNQFKGAKKIFTPNNEKCKTLSISKFNPNEYWSIERFWNDQEKKNLRIYEEKEEITLSEFSENTELISTSAIDLKSKLKNINDILQKQSNYKTSKINLIDIFDPKKGNSKYTKKYIHNNNGKYHVYSSKTKNNGIIGKINSFDYTEECLTWTTDGLYAGTVFFRNCPFSMTCHCSALFLKKEYEKKINIKYIYHILKNTLRHYSVGESNKRVTNKILKTKSILIPIPIKNNNFDMSLQDEFVKDCEEIEKIQKVLRTMGSDITRIINSNVIMS